MGVQRRRGTDELFAAKELSVPTLHQGKATSDQPNGSIAKRGCFPGFVFQSMRSEKSFSDLAVRSPRETPIQRPQHEDQTSALLLRQGKGFSDTITGVSDPVPKAQRPFDTRLRLLIDRNDDRERLINRHMGHPIRWS